jgi:hypothetical protein
MRLGADPEVFLKDKTGKHISVIGMIGANKWAPLQVAGLPAGFTLQEDNVALEFGQPPAATAAEFVFNTRQAMMAGLSKLKGKRFSRLSCTVFDKDQMEAPEAFVFGCEPDFNAWTLQENHKPTPPHPFMRSAGGHVHIELPEGHTDDDKINTVRAADVFLGVPSVLMDRSGGQRRKLYGGPGAFRRKPYGVEYRTLSNFWIFQKPLTEWVWHQTEKALKVDPAKVWFFRDEIQHAINEGCEEEAKFLIKEFDLELV